MKTHKLLIGAAIVSCMSCADSYGMNVVFRNSTKDSQTTNTQKFCIEKSKNSDGADYFNAATNKTYHFDNATYIIFNNFGFELADCIRTIWQLGVCDVHIKRMEAEMMEAADLDASGFELIDRNKAVMLDKNAKKNALARVVVSRNGANIQKANAESVKIANIITELQKLNGMCYLGSFKNEIYSKAIKQLQGLKNICASLSTPRSTVLSDDKLIGPAIISHKSCADYDIDEEDIAYVCSKYEINDCSDIVKDCDVHNKNIKDIEERLIGMKNGAFTHIADAKETTTSSTLLQDKLNRLRTKRCCYMEQIKRALVMNHWSVIERINSDLRQFERIENPEDHRLDKVCAEIALDIVQRLDKTYADFLGVNLKSFRVVALGETASRVFRRKY